MKEEIAQTIKDLLQSKRRVVIIGHKNPDGDAIGSCLGLYFFLKGRGHQTQVVMPNDFPEFLKWLPGCDQIITYDRDNVAVKEQIATAELIFTLDFNALDRTGELETELQSASADFVMIDHHQQPGDYALQSQH